MRLARQHFQKHQAAKDAQLATEYGTMQELNAYEQMLLQLNSDKARLNLIQSGQNRNDVKLQILPAYKPYIDGILQVRPGVQDMVLSQVMVWAIDCGQFDFALDIAAYVLEHELKLPDRFERSAGCFVVEDIAESFLKKLKTDVPVDIMVLQKLEALINNHDLPKSSRDMPDQVRAKLYLALAKTTFKQITGETANDLNIASIAKNYFYTALGFDDKCGGKTDLAKTEKIISKILTEQPELAASLTHSSEQLQNPSGTPVVDDFGNTVAAQSD